MYVSPCLKKVGVMLVLGVDTETSGVNVKSDRILEIGWCIWDTERKKPLKLISTMVREDTRVPHTKEITDITGITPSDINTYGISLSYALGAFLSDMAQCEAVVAHNGNNFDFPLIDNENDRVSKQKLKWVQKIDTSTDLPPKAYGKSGALSYMAADHGFINPFPHRALTDVLTMMKLMSFYPIEEIMQRALSPRVVVRACVSFEQKDLAKEQGFRWQEVGSLKFDKSWVKIIKECDYQDLADNCAFKIARIKTL